MLFAPESVGASKLGVPLNVSKPEEELIANFAASTPPVIEYVSVGAGRSASAARTVVTAAVFSAMLIDAEAPPPLLVIAGVLSLTAVTVTARFCVSVFAPSDACTTTSYTLFAPASVGDSKFGATANAIAPDEALIVNLPASAPPLME